MNSTDEIGSPGSLLGQLQRGRGKGYWRLLMEPGSRARELLLHCLTHDPRLDHQVEQRAEQYADLALELGLDLGPVAEHLRQHDAEDSGRCTELAIDTLGVMVRRGHSGAAEWLGDYLQWGQNWERLLNRAAESPPAWPLERLARAVEARWTTDADLEGAISRSWLGTREWNPLAAHSERISRAVHGSSLEDRARQGKSVVPDHLNVQQLLDGADSRNTFSHARRIRQIVRQEDLGLLVGRVSLDQIEVSRVALAGLTQLAPPELFSWACDIYLAACSTESRGRCLRSPAHQLLEALPAELTIPLARSWLHHETRPARSLAEHLFEAHAGRDDLGLLRAALVAALPDEEENCYRICSLVNALGRLKDTGEIPELAEVFVRFRYSYGRCRAACAMAETNPTEFAEQFAVECLWDCEPDTQVWGARLAPLTRRWVRRRLSELVEDQGEDEEVRAAAAQRGVTDY